MRENSIFMLVIALCGLFTFSFLGSALVERTSFHAEVRSALLVEFANENRVEQKLESLTINPILEQAAQLKANDMAQNSYFAHVSPQGIVPWHWFAQAGYSFRFAGENLAVNFDESEEVHNAWLESPTHRANILNAQFQEVGIATAEGEYKGKQVTFVVQLFGTPKTPSVNNVAQSVTIQNSSIPKPSSSAVVAALVESNPTEEKTITLSDEGDFVLGATVVNENDEKRVRALMVEDSSSNPTLLMTTLARPAHVAHYVYVVLVVLIALALTIMILVHPKKQYPKNIMYGLLILGLAFAFLIANKILFDTPINLL